MEACNSQPLDGTEVGCKVDLWRGLHGLASTDPSPFSSVPPLYPLLFCFTRFGLWWPTWRHHIASSSGKGSASSLLPLGGYRRQASSVLSPFVATGASGGPLDVMRQPPLPTRLQMFVGPLPSQLVVGKMLTFDICLWKQWSSQCLSTSSMNPKSADA